MSFKNRVSDLARAPATRHAQWDDRMSLRLLMVLTCAVVLPAIQACSQSAEAQASLPQAVPVSVAPVAKHAVNDIEEFSGRLEATDYVEIRPRVAGTIDRVHFVDGATVKKGELLFTIDPRPFEAELARAQSQLAAAKAKAELAQSQLSRARGLLESQASSKEEFEVLSSGSRTSLADIQGAEAALRVAALNVEHTQVRAPIAGRVSRAVITAGNLVNEQSVLTSIAGVSRVYAYFDGSEQTFLRLQALKAGDKAPRVQMGLANEESFPHEGKLDFVDNRLNPQTGAIRLRASFENAKGQFTPGLAARLRMESPESYDAVLVPDRAIGTDQTKKFVYVVGADNKPQFREVRPGALFGSMRVVQGGVNPGENIVVDGLQRVMPGVQVAPKVLKVDAKGMPVFPPPAAASAAQS